mmetsp:Transcript_21731/g.49128  ORF Transcript_21731/g.49128 Transcript_21731/m.49128 type:complete len:251 (-) Transcript_21731:938-1690(-)
MNPQSKRRCVAAVAVAPLPLLGNFPTLIFFWFVGSQPAPDSGLFHQLRNLLDLILHLLAGLIFAFLPDPGVPLCFGPAVQAEVLYELGRGDPARCHKLPDHGALGGVHTAVGEDGLHQNRELSQGPRVQALGGRAVSFLDQFPLLDPLDKVQVERAEDRGLHGLVLLHLLPQLRHFPHHVLAVFRGDDRAWVGFVEDTRVHDGRAPNDAPANGLARRNNVYRGPPATAIIVELYQIPLWIQAIGRGGAAV